MNKISLCMIVKNEEKLLLRCLNSVKEFVDEIVIVDTGSTDNTKQIALDFGCKVFDFEWCDDFSSARNFAFSKATGNYLLWLDADDVVPEDTLKQLIQIKHNLSKDTYMMKYDVAFCCGKTTFSYYRERILKNCGSAHWQGNVHECIVPFGEVEYLNCSIEHRKINFKKSNRNLIIYNKLKKQRQLTTREQYYYARELFDHKKYKQSLREFKKFLKCKDAWVENVIDALFLMSECCIFLGDVQNQLKYLFQTFQYDYPRANVCCKIGDHFLTDKKIETAKFWYTLAIETKQNYAKGGFFDAQYQNYYPYLQLCVCCYQLNDIKNAIFYNEMAERFNPNSVAVKHNKEFFNSIAKT